VPLQAPDGFRGVFRADPLACAVYSEAAGVARILPRAVAVPVDEEDLITLVRWAAQTGHPLIPRGSGSSMAGGAIGDGVIVDLARFDRVGAVDTHRRTLTVGAAVVRDRLEAVANAAGLTFPVDPSSGAFATIGGMCATHAAGSRTVRYGPLRDWIAGIHCVFADGTQAWIRRGNPTPALPILAHAASTLLPQVRASEAQVLRHEGVRKESSGYALAPYHASGDPIDLLLGSEGTLACITAVEVRLTPRPGATAVLLAGFETLDLAAEAAVRLADEGASAVELLDRSFLEIAASEGATLPVAPTLEAVLLIEREGPDTAAAQGHAARLAAWCRTVGATEVVLPTDATEREALWALRHAASPILGRLAPRWQSLQLIEDGCVPPAHFATYVRGVREALARAGCRGVIFGHAGDAHAHVNLLADLTDPEWRARCAQVLTDVTALVARLGGTVAGEHGDGRLRTPLLPQLWPAATLALFRAVKATFDPAGILNPGVKVGAPGADPLETMKVDPTLAPLPAAAREALDAITRERAWGRHRLDLIPGA
jgi:FAD/FMN-containing dehydrogenase